MKQTDIPAKFNIPWAQLASVPTYRRSIPQTPTGTPGQASLQQGFPAETFISKASGGTPPFGADFNGLFYQITQLLIWLMAGSPLFYDATFSAAIGGYAKGSVLQATAGPVGAFWISEVDNNTGDPDAGAPNWGSFNVLSTIGTGHCQWRPTNETLDGYVRCNGKTIGDAFSNATERANSDTFPLFDWVWDNFDNTQCPMFDQNGAAIGRGFDSTNDFKLHHAITLPDMRGQWPGGTDTMGNSSAGRLSSAVFAVGSGRVPGARGNFVQPTSGGTNPAAYFQTGTWHLRL